MVACWISSSRWYLSLVSCPCAWQRNETDEPTIMSKSLVMNDSNTWWNRWRIVLLTALLVGWRSSLCPVGRIDQWELIMGIVLSSLATKLQRLKIQRLRVKRLNVNIDTKFRGPFAPLRGSVKISFSVSDKYHGKSWKNEAFEKGWRRDFSTRFQTRWRIMC